MADATYSNLAEGRWSSYPSLEDGTMKKSQEAANAISMAEGDSLIRDIRNSLVQSQFDRIPRYFVPERTLDHLITKKSISAAMAVEQPNDEFDLLVDFIMTEAKKLFAISAFIGLEDATLRRAIVLFKKTGFTDKNLPVSYPETDSTVDNTSNDLAFLEASTNGGKKIWDTRRIYHFGEEQWKFLAPIFSVDRPNHDNPMRSILPFIWKHASFEKGSFGQVSKYAIHPNHIFYPSNPGQPCPDFFAIKEVWPLDEGDCQNMSQHWARVTQALQTLNRLNQNHIVRFITAFRRGYANQEDHFLMFEWANGGNLRNLWKAIPQPARIAPLVKATIKQLRGLAQALYAAHQNSSGTSYRHGDLKPENILWFREGSDEIGMLKIGDWGEAKSHNLVTELRFNKSPTQCGTRRYEAPEVVTGARVANLEHKRKRRSRLHDMWAMGCINLEILIWLLYGLDGLHQFSQELSDGSPFYQISIVDGRGVARVHNVVEKWVDHMAKDPACQFGTTALGDLLEIVRWGLLVVKLPRRMGSNMGLGITPSSRWPGTEAPDIVLAVPWCEQPTNGDCLITFNSTEPRRDLILQEPKPEPKPEPVGVSRLLASEYLQRLEYVLDEDAESYWFTDTPLRRTPANNNFSYFAGQKIDK